MYRVRWGVKVKGSWCPSPWSSVPLSFIKIRYGPRPFLLHQCLPPRSTPVSQRDRGFFCVQIPPTSPVVDLSNCDEKPACWTPDLSEHLQQTSYAQRELPSLKPYSRDHRLPCHG